MSGFSIRCSFSHARFPSDRRGAMRPPCPVCCGCWYRIVASAGVALYTVMVKRALQPTFCDSPRAFFPVRPCLPAAAAFALASAIASGVVWSSGPNAHWYVVLCSTAALHDDCPARLLVTTANAAPPSPLLLSRRQEGGDICGSDDAEVRAALHRIPLHAIVEGQVLRMPAALPPGRTCCMTS